MSVEAISWVLNEAPGVPPQLVAALIGLANHAGPDGRGAYPSQATLCRYTRKEPRTIRTDLVKLEKIGLIKRGDQRLTDHLPPDKRPIVWDLVVGSTGGPSRTGGSSTAPRSSRTARPSTAGPGGRTRPVAGGRTRPPNRPVEPTTEPSNGGAPASEARSAPSQPPPRRPDGLTEIPGDFRPTDSMRRWVVSTFGAAIDVEYETEQFISHYRSTGARRKSWPDAWQKWIRESAQRRSGRATGVVVPIDRRQQATNDQFDRAMQRAIAREEGT